MKQLMAYISQLVIVFWYVKYNSVCEDFIGFIDCYKENFDLNKEEPKITGVISGQTVLNILKKFLLCWYIFLLIYTSQMDKAQ